MHVEQLGGSIDEEEHKIAWAAEVSEINQVLRLHVTCE